MLDVFMNNALSMKKEQKDRKRVRLSVPREGLSLARVTEARAGHIRKAVARLAGGFDEPRLLQSFHSIFAPRWDLDFGFQKDLQNLNLRAAWNLVCVWLLARGSDIVSTSDGFRESEDWFIGNSRISEPRLSSIISLDSLAQAHHELLKVSFDEDFWDLLPYVLEEHGPGSRASVLREPATKTARNIKKNNGVFYTPADVADYMVRHLLAEYTGDISHAKCLDPACGTGVFLLSMCRAAEEYSLMNGKKHFDRFRYIIDNLFGCDISVHAVDTCTFVLLHHCLIDVTKRGLSPWAAWHAIRLNLAVVDSLTLASVKPDSASTCNAALSLREKQKEALIESTTTWIDAEKEQLNQKSDNSIHSLFPSQRMIQIGELFTEAAKGFNFLIGNPPYSYLGKRIPYDLLTDEYHCLSRNQAGPNTNVFLLFIEMMWRLTTPAQNSSAMVTPLSIAYNSGSQYTDCRKAMARQGGRWQFAFFDREPHALFGEEVKTRNAILFHIENESTPTRGEIATIETGPLLKWTSRTRNRLFESIRFTGIGTADITGGIPKIEGPLQAKAYALLHRSQHAPQSFCAKIGTCSIEHALNSSYTNRVYVGGTAYNFLNIFHVFSIDDTSEFPLTESPVHYLEFSSETNASVAYAILSSRLIFWLWHVQSDGFHVSNRFIRSIPFDRESFTSDQLIHLGKLGRSLWKKVQGHRFCSINGGKRTYTFRPLSFNSERDAIDSVLIDAAGLSSEFILELKDFVRKIVIVDADDLKRQHLLKFFN